MAERIQLFQVTTPAGTPQGTPLVTALPMDEAAVERIEVTVPSGHAGFVGFRFAHSRQVIIPFDGTAWIITDNAELSWPVQGYPTGDKWTLLSYNTDLFDHTLYIRMMVNELPSAPAPAPTLLTIE